MKIAIYGRPFNVQSIAYAQQVVDALLKQNVEVIIYEEFYRFLSQNNVKLDNTATFNSHQELINNTNYLLSLGGDGTLLDTVTLVRDSNIPILGINFGRLGFLATVNKLDIDKAIDSLIKGHYTLDTRALIRLESSSSIFGDVNFGLNEVTIHKQDASPMIIIHTYLNGEFLNSYWADGLIVSTPTGSTAYSLSCGGPIIFPRSGNFVITPICAHNLNVRPVVLSDSNVITFEIESRASQFLVSIDSRTVTVDNNIQIAVRRENFQLNLLRLNNENYLETLRQKLMWGLDSRN